jgi:hypothetical protein
VLAGYRVQLLPGTSVNTQNCKNANAVQTVQVALFCIFLASIGLCMCAHFVSFFARAQFIIGLKVAE